MFNCKSDLWICGAKKIEDIMKIQHFLRPKTPITSCLLLLKKKLMVIKINFKLNQCFEQILFISRVKA